jgi:hypothetical protein
MTVLQLEQQIIIKKIGSSLYSAMLMKEGLLLPVDSIDAVFSASHVNSFTGFCTPQTSNVGSSAFSWQENDAKKIDKIRKDNFFIFSVIKT